MCVCVWREREDSWTTSVPFQVNSTEVLGLDHDQAIEVVKETPANVMIVVCRNIQSVNGDGEGEEQGEGQGEREAPGEEQRESHFTGSLLIIMMCIKLYFVCV